MKFYREDLTDEELRGGLISAAIGLFTVLPVIVTLFLPRTVPLRPDYLVGSFSTFGIVIVFVAVQLVLVRRSGRAHLTPLAAFGLVLLLEIGVSLINAGGGGPPGLYRGLLLLNAVFVGIIGDFVMQASFWVCAVGLVSWSSWVTGLRGGTLATVILVSAATMASCQAMVGRTIRGYGQFGRSTTMLDGITDVAIASDTFEEGLGKALGILAGFFPTDHLTVLVRTVGRSDWTVVAGWPSTRPDDRELARQAPFIEAIASAGTVVTRERCFAPVGFTGAGELVLVMDRTGGNWRGDPFSPEMIGAMAAGLLRVASQVDQVDLLRATSRTDPLTGLSNRRVLAERAEAELARSRRSRSALSVAIIDVDHFKAYNDDFGHLAGDQLLASISLIMKDRLRGQDLLVRYGGEEFCLLLPDVATEGARAVLDDLRELARATPAHRNVTISGGVAEWDGTEEFEALLERADQALYAAKRGGRDRIEVAPLP